MKAIKTICIALAACSIAMPLFAQERMRVAVLDLKADGVSTKTASAISNILRTDLVNAKKFVVIERAQMNTILEEQGFQMTGCTDSACAVKVGKLMSANKILVGEVSGVAGKIHTTVRIVDVEKGVSDYAARESFVELCTVILICLGTFACYFDAERDNPYDMKASTFAVPTDIYMFATDVHDGNLGGRDGADALCSAKRASSYSTLPGKNVRAFISISDSDEIRDMPGNFGVRIDTIIKGPSGIKIADDWYDLTDGDIDISLYDAGVTEFFWWSGSDTLGNFVPVHSCDGFTNGTSFYDAYVGVSKEFDTDWFSGAIQSCDIADKVVLCVCWE